MLEGLCCMSFNTVKKNTCRNPIKKGGRGKVEGWMDVGLADELLVEKKKRESFVDAKRATLYRAIKDGKSSQKPDHSSNSEP